MKKLLTLIIIPFFSFGQVPDSKSQLKVLYSTKYEKVPFQMKLFKKHLPTKVIEYRSKLGSRNEINFDAKILGQNILNSTINVDNDSLTISWIKTETIINDSIVDSEFIETNYSPIEQNVFIGDKRKNILGYDCVNFVTEDDSVKTEGFLAPDIIVTGEFQKYGLPLEFKSTSKKGRFVVSTKADQIIIEPLEANIFILKKD